MTCPVTVAMLQRECARIESNIKANMSDDGVSSEALRDHRLALRILTDADLSDPKNA